MKKITSIGNLQEIQAILLEMAQEVHNSNSNMDKADIALMFRKADSIRDMAKYMVASQNAINQGIWLDSDNFAD